MGRTAVKRILIVDDDHDFASLLEHSLSQDSFEVELACNGWEGLKRAYTFQPDLILMDIRMPNMDGWELLRRIRELTEVPVLLVTGVSGEEAKVRGLDLGADDYVVKPFGLHELKARIQAVLRRAAVPPSEDRHLLRFHEGSLVIDPHSQKVIADGDLVELTPTEYKLLLFLAYNAGRVLGHEQILEAVWGLGYEGGLNSVKVYIRRLRHKIEPDPRHPRYIQSQRGVGYFMTDL